MALYCPDHSGTKDGLATIPVSCPTCIIESLRAELEGARATLAAADRLRERLDLYQPSSSLIEEYDALRDAAKGEK